MYYGSIIISKNCIVGILGRPYLMITIPICYCSLLSIVPVLFDVYNLQRVLEATVLSRWENTLFLRGTLNDDSWNEGVPIDAF